MLVFHRMQFSWDEREKDFERYRPPPPCFSPTPPITIHLAGESRAKELADFNQREHEMWQAKLVVENTNFGVVRRGIRTELGSTACCQADKLQSLLKHDPTRKGLAPTEQLRVDNIPALSVLSTGNKEEEEEGRSGAGFTPGPHSNRSLRLSCNVIPIPRAASPRAPAYPKGLQQLFSAVGEHKRTPNERSLVSS